MTTLPECSGWWPGGTRLFYLSAIITRSHAWVKSLYDFRAYSSEQPLEQIHYT